MLDALRILRYSVSDAWDELAVLVVFNVVWGLCALAPLLPIFLVTDLLPQIAASLVLGLPLPVVSGAVCHVTNQVARGRAATWDMFVEGVQRYWAKSLAVAAVNLVALGILFSNLYFYAFVIEETWADVALSAWVVGGIYWGLVQIYWFPMLLEIESEKVFEALRRAATLVIISPGFSLSVGILASVLVTLCILSVVPALALMASLLLLVINHATRSRLAFVQKEPYRPHEIE